MDSLRGMFKTSLQYMEVELSETTGKPSKGILFVRQNIKKSKFDRFFIGEIFCCVLTWVKPIFRWKSDKNLIDNVIWCKCLISEILHMITMFEKGEQLLYLHSFAAWAQVLETIPHPGVAQEVCQLLTTNLY